MPDDDGEQAGALAVAPIARSTTSCTWRVPNTRASAAARSDRAHMIPINFTLVKRLALSTAGAHRDPVAKGRLRQRAVETVAHRRVRGELLLDGSDDQLLRDTGDRRAEPVVGASRPGACRTGDEDATGQRQHHAEHHRTEAHDDR